MKYTYLIFAMLLGVFSQAFAQDAKNEEQCKLFVAQTVSSLAEQSRRYGEDIKLYDLSDENILDIQSKKGSCAAMDEINIRLSKK
jgi:hypothetical protein